MARTKARSSPARKALKLVETLQGRFVAKLEELGRNRGAPQAFEPVDWLRDDGRHGGGRRFEIDGTQIFGRASVNVSQVHYDDDPGKKLGSATALSAIIHPENPHASSVHIHISWTEMRNGEGYWRMMADLNPSIEDPAATKAFAARLRHAAPEQYDYAQQQGDRYFFIPALARPRGVTHFYLESYSTEDPMADARLARSVGEAAIDAYVGLLNDALDRAASDAERSAQLSYHTLYLFQVLTLDRGTSAGLLVHDQNDIGILGSLPAHVDRELLAAWEPRMDPPQDELLRRIVEILPDSSPSPVTIEAKEGFAAAIRVHYRKHPQALKLQAAADIVPPTVDNHN
ncbi:MAG: coproporphyrinogen III oxidase [Planctomycetes bacterium]|nr:coproporphyrinogen III oxidase [Planctomycetota bacterium]